MIYSLINPTHFGERLMTVFATILLMTPVMLFPREVENTIGVIWMVWAFWFLFWNRFWFSVLWVVILVYALRLLIGVV